METSKGPTVARFSAKAAKSLYIMYLVRVHKSLDMKNFQKTFWQTHGLTRSVISETLKDHPIHISLFCSNLVLVLKTDFKLESPSLWGERGLVQRVIFRGCKYSPSYPDDISIAIPTTFIGTTALHPSHFSNRETICFALFQKSKDSTEAKVTKTN